MLALQVVLAVPQESRQGTLRQDFPELDSVLASILQLRHHLLARAQEYHVRGNDGVVCRCRTRGCRTSQRFLHLYISRSRSRREFVF